MITGFNPVQRSAQQLEQDDEMTLATMTIPQRLVSKHQGDVAWNFLRQSILPWDFRQPPPTSAYESQSTTQQGTVNLNFRVLAPPAPGTEGIVTSSGMFLHLPQFAWNALFHMAFVPRNAVSTVAFANGLGVFNTSLFPLPVIVPTVLTSFTFLSELAVPHSQSGYVPSFTPDIASKFNRARVYGGAMEMFCQTISTANIPYNGRWAATVLNDTTDVAQTDDGFAFPANQLTQSSRNDKEKKLNEPLYDGAMVVIGDDLREDFIVPNQFADDSIAGTWAQLGTFPGTNYAPVLRLNGDATAKGLMSAWITPWNIRANFPLPATGYTDQFPQLQTNQIGEADGLDIRCVLTYAPATLNMLLPPTIQNAECIIKMTCTHVYAFVANVATGALGFRTITDQQVSPVSRNPFGFVMEVEINSYAKPYIGLNGMQGPPNVSSASEAETAIAGKYIGSMVTATVLSGQGDLAAGDSAYGNMSNIQYRFMARARQNSSLGHVGPAHIIRYDGVGADQEITFNAAINVEVVAEADLSQYIKTSDAGVTHPANNNIVNTLSALYRSDALPEWKCCWKRSEWEENRRRLLERGTAGFVGDIIKKSGPLSDVVATTQAAGLFSSLGGLLDGITGTSGDFDNGSYAGGQFGSRRGRSEAGGQFGSSMAGGQFGSRAGGQFGSSMAGAQFGHRY